MNLESTVNAFGGLAPTSQLRGCGNSRSAIARAVAHDEIVRVCIGWVATRRAPVESVIAVLHGGKLTGSTALAQRGNWDAGDKRIHVQIPAHAYGKPRIPLTPLTFYTRDTFAPHGVVRHWRPESALDRSEPQWRTSTIDSLLIVAKTAPLEQFIASAESCLNSRTLAPAGLPLLRASLPRRLRSAVDEFEPRSGSGLESLFRLRVAALGCRIEVQVEMPGIGPQGRRGFVDFLLDGWLVVETDGDAFHDPAIDRVRNGILVRLGYRWHRIGYHQIVHDWAEVEATLVELLRYPPAPAASRRKR